MTSTLDQLPMGCAATISDLSFSGIKRRRMLDLGFIPGTTVAALHASPWGNPIAYAVRGAVIALRNEDAKYISISGK